MKLKIILILFLIGIGCATPPPEMINKESSLLSINVSFTYLPLPLLPLEGQYFSPDLVYFVKLEDDTNDLFSQTQILVSNYYNDYGVFIANVEPGKYIAIAAHYKSKHDKKAKDYILMFPKKVIQSTIVDVKLGSIVYMGDVKLDQQPIFRLSNKANNFDDLQSYFYNLLVPFELPSAISFFLTDTRYANATLVSFNKNIDDFIKNQEKYFKDTKWYNRILQCKSDNL
ncbi:MAG: hypothetical protein JXB49_13895 [Bacteroidales bacterium]|nr:hypothetical protein [Bacteroidales bacterium]